MKTNKANKLVALMLSATMAMSAFVSDVHAEEASGAWKIGVNTYETLQAAIDATSGEAATIELLSDANGNGAIVPSGKNITIDFNQHVYDITGDLVGSTGTATQALQLLKGSTVTLKNGEIKSTKAKMLVQNYANLTIDSMKLDGSSLNATKPYTLSNNCGNVVIKDSEIIAKAGGYAFDVYYWPTFGYTDGVTVSVEGQSKIIGDVEYDSDGSADGKANVAEKAKLNIKGGSFSGKFVTSGLNDDGKTGISISGGSFAVKPAEEYLAEGFHLNEDGSVLEDGAEEKAALETLKAAIAAADTAYDETKTYTETSKKAFDAAYTAAKDLVDDEDATAEAMTKAAADLNEAVKNLEEETAAVDVKAQLVEKISEAEGYLKDGNAYTEDSLKALETALNDAKALADDADDEAVTEALNALTKAINDLKLVETPSLDLTKLNAAIEAANKMLKEAIDSGLYADAIIEECKLAIKAAEALRDTATLQSQINEGIKALDEAMKNLVPNEEPGTDPEPDTEEPGTEEPDDENFVIVDKETDIKVTAPAGVLDSDVQLVVKPITAKDVNDNIAAALNSLEGEITAFDIKLMKDNVLIQPNGTVTVTMNVPKDFYSMRYSLYHIDENGKLTSMPFITADYELSFDTDHFSIFVLVNEGELVFGPSEPNKKPETKPADKDDAAIKNTASTPNTGDHTTAVASVLLLVCAGAYLGFNYKRKGNNA